MFKHLLLPTDGSKLSDRAVQRGLDFAKEIGAKVTAVHVIPRPHDEVADGIPVIETGETNRKKISGSVPE